MLQLATALVLVSNRKPNGHAERRQFCCASEQALSHTGMPEQKCRIVSVQPSTRPVVVSMLCAVGTQPALELYACNGNAATACSSDGGMCALLQLIDEQGVDRHP